MGLGTPLIVLIVSIILCICIHGFLRFVSYLIQVMVRVKYIAGQAYVNRCQQYVQYTPVLALYDPFGVDVPLNFDITHWK